jgi:hypothetical protein
VAARELVTLVDLAQGHVELALDDPPTVWLGPSSLWCGVKETSPTASAGFTGSLASEHQSATVILSMTKAATALSWLPSLSHRCQEGGLSRPRRGSRWVSARVASVWRVRVVAFPKCRRAGSGRPRWM